MNRCHRYRQEILFLAVIVGFSACVSWADPFQIQGHKLERFLLVLAGPLGPFIFYTEMVAREPIWPIVYLLTALAPWAYRVVRKKGTWLSIALATLLWIFFGWMLAIAIWI